MINNKQLAKSGKEKREALERKKVLLGLANDIKFESVMFPKPFGFSSREDLRYYLWMRELELWLMNNKYDDLHENHINMLLGRLSSSLLESSLIDILKILLPKDK